MDNPMERYPTVVALTTVALESLGEASESLVYATVATDDGYLVSSIMDGEFPDSNMAGMASSMQALGDGVTRGLSLGSSDYIIVAADAGYLIQLRIPGHPLVVSAVFNGSETVGTALSAARASAAHLFGLLTTDAA